jgi:hypothetical protein
MHSKNLFEIQGYGGIEFHHYLVSDRESISFSVFYKIVQNFIDILVDGLEIIKKGWIFTDIKSENMVFDSRDGIRIIDYKIYPQESILGSNKKELLFTMIPNILPFQAIHEKIIGKKYHKSILNQYRKLWKEEEKFYENLNRMNLRGLQKKYLHKKLTKDNLNRIARWIFTYPIIILLYIIQDSFLFQEDDSSERIYRRELRDSLNMIMNDRLETISDQRLIHLLKPFAEIPKQKNYDSHFQGSQIKITYSEYYNR